MFNGHKYYHVIKYQGVVTPDGIIIHLSEGYAGTAHDSTIYTESGIHDILEQWAYDANHVPLALYGDSAYVPNNHLLNGYKAGHLTDDQAAFNQTMASLRIEIKWAFKHITQQFSCINF